MTSLASALANASRKFAEPIAQAYASGNRPYKVRLERPGPPGTFNRDTGTFNKRTSELIYEGPARFYPSAESLLDVGDEERVPFNEVRVTLDYFTKDNTPDPTMRPQADDIIVVTEDSFSQSQHLPNRVFEVTGVEVGGHMSVGWTLQAIGAAPSRAGQTP